MIFAKKFGLSGSSSSASLDWSYEHYIEQMKSASSGVTFTTSPTCTQINSVYSVFIAGLYPIVAFLKNTNYLLGINQSGYYCVYNLDTQTIEYTYTGVSLSRSSAIDTNNIFNLPDGRLIIVHITDIYMADDIFCTNIRKIKTISGLSSSSHGTRSTIDSSCTYLFFWYNEGSQIARLNLETFVEEDFSLSGITWHYSSMVLPDGSLLCDTISQQIHRFSGTNYSTHVYTALGSYAGFTGAFHIVEDGYATEIGSTRSGNITYFDMYTTAGYSTISFGNSDYWAGVKGPLPCGQYCLVTCSNSSSGKNTGMYIENPITGYLQKVTLPTPITVSEITSGFYYVKSLLNGKVLLVTSSSSNSYILDFQLSKTLDNSAITSPWFYMLQNIY